MRRDRWASSELGSRRLLGAAWLALLVGCQGVIGGASGTDPDGEGAAPRDEAPEGAAGSLSERGLQPRIWRLGRAEYNAELRRLFGPSVPAADLPAAPRDDSNFANASSARVDTTNAARFANAAGATARWLVGDGSAALGCEDGSTGDACLEHVLSWLPSAAYRRPTSPSDLEPFRTLYRSYRDDHGATHDDALEAVARAILLAPEFLYRTELGSDAPVDADGVRLTGDEIATLLAFGLTGEGPDTALLEDRDWLTDPDVREAHARRLFARSGAMWMRFFGQWLRMESLAESEDPVEIEARESLRRLIEEVVLTRKGSLADLLTTREAWLGPELARIYGVEPGETELPDAERAGLLTRVAWLSTHASVGDHVVVRGMGIFRDAMCNDIHTPEGVDIIAASEALVGPDASVSDLVRERAQAPGCTNCHRLADPVGLTLEGYDRSGRSRTHYDDGALVETTVELPDSGELSGAVELSQFLAEDPAMRRCMVRRFLQHFVGEDLGGPEESAWPQRIDAALVEAGGSIEAMVVALVRDPAFIERKQEGEE